MLCECCGMSALADFFGNKLTEELLLVVLLIGDEQNFFLEDTGLRPGIHQERSRFRHFQQNIPFYVYPAQRRI